MGRRDADALPPVRKSLGQHFLNDRRILTRIVDALAPGPGDTVVEIGPGRGALTEILRERSRRVVAIEVDRALAARLRAQFAGSNVDVVEADVLETDLGAIAAGPFLLVGNVPYYITTPILFQSLRPPRAERAVFLVQREVAERMKAMAGEREYGALSVNLQALASVEMVSRVPAGAFQPPPKVDSAIVRVTPLRDPVVAPGEEAAFRGFVQSVFSMRRKQMRRVVRELQPMSPESADALLRSAGIEPEDRPERVAVPAFAKLRRILTLEDHVIRPDTLPS